MSWSFRKDCIGFARSLLPSSVSSSSSLLGKDLTREEEEAEEREEESLDYLLCVLIGYFVSTVSHDVDEWLTWGVPYVDICVTALDVDSSLTEKIRDRFMGTVGRGYLFVFEEEEEDGWTDITPLPSFLSGLAEKLVVYEEKHGGDVQTVLDGFLGAMQKAVTLGKYDTRTRVLISRRICLMLQLESQQPQQQREQEQEQEQEQEICSDDDISHCNNSNTAHKQCDHQLEEERQEVKSTLARQQQEAFELALLRNLTGGATSGSGNDEKKDLTSVLVPAFRTGVKPQQVAAAVNSFRALKIGVAAASGGALMFCAGGLAAPSIMSSLLASLTGMTAAGSTSAMLADLGLLLNTYGLPVITSAATTLGSTVASWKMMRRTDPLKEFALEPLHAPHTADVSGNTILVGAPEGYRKSSVKRPLFSLLSSSASSDRSVAPPLPPEAQEVFLLVPGHFSGQSDLCELWGGDQDVALDDQDREGAMPGSSFRFTCRPAGSSAPTPTHQSSSSPSSLLSPSANICRGWWSEVTADERGVHGEPYVVRWDPVELTRLYHAQQTFLLEKSVTVAVEEMLKFASPVFGAAALPLTVLERAAELDCPWLVVMDRAEQAGRLLAALLLENAAAPQLSSDREHQLYRQRSVNLIGYGFGARVIFHCLLLLAEAPNKSGLGIVQDAVLIGAPVPTHAKDWAKLRKVVSGRLVNCYKRDDWMLGLMYRSKAWEVGVAGLAPVRLHVEDDNSSEHEKAPDKRNPLPPSSSLAMVVALQQHDPAWRTEVENIDVGDLVSSHLLYGDCLRAVLERVGLTARK